MAIPPQSRFSELYSFDGVASSTHTWVPPDRARDEFHVDFDRGLWNTCASTATGPEDCAMHTACTVVVGDLYAGSMRRRQMNGITTCYDRPSVMAGEACQTMLLSLSGPDPSAIYTRFKCVPTDGPRRTYNFFTLAASTESRLSIYAAQPTSSTTTRSVIPTTSTTSCTTSISSSSRPESSNAQEEASGTPAAASSSSDRSAIIGHAVAGCLAFLLGLLVLFIAFWLWWKKQKRGTAAGKKATAAAAAFAAPSQLGATTNTTPFYPASSRGRTDMISETPPIAHTAAAATPWSALEFPSDRHAGVELAHGRCSERHVHG